MPADRFRRIEELRELINKAERAIDRAIRDIQYYRNTTYPYNFGEAFSIVTSYRDLRDEALNRLKNRMRNALEEMEEYNLPQFSNALFSGLDGYPDPIRISAEGQTITVDIPADEIWGPISDWGAAVVATRAIISDPKRKMKTPQGASNVWKFGIYLVDREDFRVVKTVRYGNKIVQKDYTDSYYKGRYFNTIALRLANTSTPAPFWALLEHGNVDVGMPGSWGGTPYPVHFGTNFVANSEQEIQELYRIEIEQKREELDEFSLNEIDQYDMQISRLEREIAEMLAEIDELLGPIEPPGGPSNFEIAYRVVEERLEELGRRHFATEERIRELASQLVAGDPQKRIQLGTDIVRIRTIELYREYLSRVGG